MTKDDDIFKGTSFSSLLKDIYDNSRKKDRQIKLLIAQLEPLVKNLNDASGVVPLIKEYLEVSVKNDDQLVRMAAIAQKLLDKADGDGGLLLSEEEKRQLLEAKDDIDSKIESLKKDEDE